MTQSVLSSFLAQSDEIETVFKQFQEKKNLHAYLISGEKGFGKRTLADLLSSALLCSSADTRPCGICKNCILSEKHEHPDLIIIDQGIPLAQNVKKDRATIPVEDIREMIRLCGVRSTEGNNHVVLIHHADKMTVQAQNCLLKTLEEPPPDTCIILTTEHPEVLLPTIQSRCGRIRLKAWKDSYIFDVLSDRGIPSEKIHPSVFASDGSIGRAIEIASDNDFWKLRDEVMERFFRCTSRSEVLAVSGSWKDRKQDAEMIFKIIGQYVSMLSEARFFPQKQVDLSAFPDHWKKFSAESSLQGFVILSDAVSEALNQLQYSVNFQAIVEKALFIFMGEGNKWLQ